MNTSTKIDENEVQPVPDNNEQDSPVTERFFSFIALLRAEDDGMRPLIGVQDEAVCGA
ncbi:MAG: hypothetical protein JWO00_268 [Candidatus Parcubacteria bacterium]|nr:hypothetical protein [Candidatus Parcubacteria bacterium]